MSLKINELNYIQSDGDFYENPSHKLKSIKNQQMNRFVLFFTLITIFFIGCKKEDIVFNTDLALDSRFIILNAPADTTKIVVYSDHNWTMENRDNASWITIQKGSGNGTAYAIVAVPNNTSDYPRAATLLFKAGNKIDTLKLGQRGIVTPALAITAASVAAPAAGGVVQTAINTTLPLSAMNVGYTYAAGNNWISGLQIADGKVSFSVTGNETAEARTAKVYLSYSDVLGINIRDSLTVNQPRP
ncbi:BACON domain-containing protein [Niabella ginsengisoli]|uniref:BACON domain-containing protein n=1 Tax=Niabella ginsengisoli TaxID=522298 RepID=A0ABS9SDL3_9BACT|nr:BACON domain-containing protein [Niabella ginsengisoli]MCH5596447.1 BACON domain-containing protein [Niabella ginsengisoli]